MNILHFILLSASLYSSNVCDQRTGNEYFRNSNDDAAYKMLQGCENDKNVTGRTLGQLAFLYGYLGYGIFSSDELRAKKMFTLIVRAAKLGDPDSVELLFDIYKTGEDMIPISPNSDIAECLNKLAGSGIIHTDSLIDGKAVSKCLSYK